MQDTHLSQMPGHLIRRLNQHSTSVFQMRMREAGHDVTPVQFAALDTLCQHANRHANQPPTGLDQAGLAQRIGYDPATLGGVVKRLESKGYITRQPDPDDRRAMQLKVTEHGIAFLARITPIVASLQKEILPNLSATERDRVLSLMHKTLGLS
jgi:DNA-binding MarR family transcriptional regulator